jgi:6-pyruvoyl-tetrahydropterin synthase
MYSITGGIFIHFGHHVRGHDGPCISLHGHTWKFEVCAASERLDPQGFVIDFDLLQARVLDPCHALLDHSLAIGAPTWEETHGELAAVGQKLVSSRLQTLGDLGKLQPALDGELCGARNERPGGIKVSVFPFTPTSERLAEWLYRVAEKTVADERVRIASARIYESMHPTELYAEFRPH